MKGVRGRRRRGIVSPRARERRVHRKGGGAGRYHRCTNCTRLLSAYFCNASLRLPAGQDAVWVHLCKNHGEMRIFFCFVLFCFVFCRETGKRAAVAAEEDDDQNQRGGSTRHNQETSSFFVP